MRRARRRTTHARLAASAGLAGALALAACGGPPDADSLRASFAERIASIDTVDDFARDGDAITFSGPDGAGGRTVWSVRIDSAAVEAQDSEEHPHRGVIQSSWRADGRPIEPAGATSNLPSDFLDAGIAQDCWGLWDAAERRWTW